VYAIIADSRNMNPSIWTPYCGAAPDGGVWRWNLDPVLLAALAIGLLVVAMQLEGRRRLFGIAGVMALVVGFVSPVCALSSALFSARTLHHVLLVGAAAPLLALALPRRSIGPLVLATMAQVAVFWAWHAPGLYAAALSNDLVYWLMQVTVLGSAVWFWAAARMAPAPAAVVALLAAMLAMGLLGAILTFASQPVYVPHFATTLAWGLTPLEDQQTAGLIMWAPASALYLFAALGRAWAILGPTREIPA